MKKGRRGREGERFRRGCRKVRAGEVREKKEEEAAERETCWEGGGEEEAFMGVSSESSRGGC